MNGLQPVGKAPWWKGRRGEWYVVVQVLLFALVGFGPRTVAGMPAWTGWLAELASPTGVLLMLAGGGLMLAAFMNLGKGLTPLPYPKDDGQLIQTGVYGFIRHPIYCGGFALALGWALFVCGSLTVVYALLLLLFLDVKSRREERWLSAKFPAYADYQKRVRKLIPFLY
jgi:protein-S-isoprenylcysteine O-methyltransferase Ste14